MIEENVWLSTLDPHVNSHRRTWIHTHAYTHKKKKKKMRSRGHKKSRKIDEKEKAGETTPIPSDQDFTLWLIASLEASPPQTPMLEFRGSTNDFHTEGHSLGP